ncbi:hypothetical protein BS50DRAFT_568147 [Corynespora cassiicola Philippines]|uniref:Uncharacterized protein n=1 Tax=Corynespora cassiicola Philippines TaxID=1448308 RepID=A0A2T2PCU5_CORCC|nr:hypothetical protein BS50DRAFT_568147 [Corynespora cassiicola Philippines]
MACHAHDACSVGDSGSDPPRRRPLHAFAPHKPLSQRSRGRPDEAFLQLVCERLDFRSILADISFSGFCKCNRSLARPPIAVATIVCSSLHVLYASAGRSC